MLAFSVVKICLLMQENLPVLLVCWFKLYPRIASPKLLIILYLRGWLHYTTFWIKEATYIIASGEDLLAKRLEWVRLLGSLFQINLLFTKLRKRPVYSVKLDRFSSGSVGLALIFLVVNKSYMISSFLLYLSNLQFHASFLICVPCCEGQHPLFLLWQSELCVFGDGAGGHTFTFCTNFLPMYFSPAVHRELVLLNSIKIFIKTPGPWRSWKIADLTFIALKSMTELPSALTAAGSGSHFTWLKAG